jgi:hypothetical protein
MLEVLVNGSNGKNHPYKISGRFAAHNRLSKRGKAKLARDILDGRAQITDLTHAGRKDLSCECSVHQ